MIHIRWLNRAKAPKTPVQPVVVTLEGLIGQAEAKANYAIQIERKARQEADPIKRARLMAQAATIYAQCDRLAARAYNE